VVDKFIDNLCSSTLSGVTGYPGRLMAIGLKKSEVKAQCMDLIFVGTHPTAINLATIFRQLVLNPEKCFSAIFSLSYASLTDQIQNSQKSTISKWLRSLEGRSYCPRNFRQ
jgi:hypothetical protein